jgi:hypothetical protein
LTSPGYGSGRTQDELRHKAAFTARVSPTNLTFSEVLFCSGVDYGRRGIRNTISRRKVVQGAAATVALGAASIQAQQGQRLRFVAHADLKILDPVWTTAYITRNRGYLVYDTLFGMARSFKSNRKWSIGLPYRRTA